MYPNTTIFNCLPSIDEVASVNEMLDHALSVAAYNSITELEFNNDVLRRLLNMALTFKQHLQQDLKLEEEHFAALFDSECSEEDIRNLLGRISRFIRVDAVQEFESPELEDLNALEGMLVESVDKVIENYTVYLITAWDAWGPELLTYRHTTVYTKIVEQGTKVYRIEL